MRILISNITLQKGDLDVFIESADGWQPKKTNKIALAKSEHLFYNNHAAFQVFLVAFFGTLTFDIPKKYVGRGAAVLRPLLESTTCHPLHLHHQISAWARLSRKLFNFLASIRYSFLKVEPLPKMALLQAYLTYEGLLDVNGASA